MALEPVRVDCNAKINLYLRIVGKRADGYHDIEALFHSIALHDTLWLKPSHAGISVVCENDQVPLDDSNTAAVAARVILKGTGKGLSIGIEKRIPVGAGLGGGSADAAGVLVGVNTLYRLGHRVDDLERMAAQVGADVAFLIRGGCAVGLGRGDRLDRMPALPALPVLLVVPPLTISTSWAYASHRMGLTRSDSRLNMITSALERGDSTSLLDLLNNDFEGLVFEKHPKLRDLKQKLVECGAGGALMTGSGPVVFGVFAKDGDAEACKGRFPKRDYETILTRLADSSVTVTR
jgi:4-diphosphocytidyl-2-C-methyl-D-erythritol kinase